MNESTAADIGIKKIYQIDRFTLGVDWTDGMQSRWRLATLRRRCPCAVCVDEWSGKPLLDPSTVDGDVSANRVDSVGRYALRIDFSDGHNTGIYSYPYLRQIASEQPNMGVTND